MSARPSARRARLSAKGGGSLRSHVAGGVVVNALFSIGLQGISFLRGLLVAVFLAPQDYGVWAIISVAYLALGQLKQVGIPDKYIQQDDPDEAAAFQKAFTLEALLTGGMGVFLAIATPLIALAYRAPEVIAPGLFSLLALPGYIMQTPLWVYQREMDFKRQRTLGSVDPIVGAVVTVAAAVAGAGFWAFALGNVLGAWAGAAVISRNAIYPIRWRLDRATYAEYVRFSKPLLLASFSNLFLIQGTMLVARSAIGVAGIGAMSLTNSIRIYTAFADGIISSTMYPAVCAVKDRTELMFEGFVKSNRLALMWGAPFGIAISLFAHDLLNFIFGRQWLFATDLFVAVGIVSAIGHVAFNWDDYVRASGDTRPLARYSWTTLVAWGLGPIPLMIAYGLRGYAIGMVAVSCLTLVLRGAVMRRLFPGFNMLPHAIRGLAPLIPPVLVVLVVRAAEHGTRTAPVALAELAIYLDLAIIVTWLLEGPLLRETFGYLRGARRRAALPTTS